MALVSSAGVHLHADRPFDVKSDPSFRQIPRHATAAELAIAHPASDRRDAVSDLNLVLHLERCGSWKPRGVIRAFTGALSRALKAGGPPPRARWMIRGEPVPAPVSRAPRS